MNKFAGHNFARAIVLDLGLGPNFGMHKWAIVKQPMGRPLPRPSHADEDQALSLSLSLSLFSLSLSLCLSSLSLSLSLSLFSRSPLEYGCPVAAELDRLALRRLEAGSVGNETACHGCLPSSPKRRGGKQDWSRNIYSQTKKRIKKEPKASTPNAPIDAGTPIVSYILPATPPGSGRRYPRAPLPERAAFVGSLEHRPQEPTPLQAVGLALGTR